MGISCFSVDFGIEGWCQPTPNFSSLSDCHPNKLARKRFFSLQRVGVCVCARASARADRGHSSTCLHSFPLSQPSLRAAVLLKQIGASRLCHRTTQHPSHGVSGREAKANKTDKGEIRARKHLQNRGGERGGESGSGRREEKREMLQKKRRESSDNPKLNSHHVRVEQNSIVFIGNSQPEGNYILKLAWMHTRTHACTHARAHAWTRDCTRVL